METYTQHHKIFEKYGLRLSLPRLVIYDYLLKNRVHPGAEAIYRQLHEEHPTLSLTTVYNTLKAFHAHGVVKLIRVEGGELRYDVNTQFHAHFKCYRCGRLFDMPSPNEKSILKRLPPGFRVSDTSVDFHGLCQECAEATKSPNASSQ